MEVDQRRQRLEALYIEYADAVYGYARRRTGAAAAEDVLMEVFVVVCRRLEAVPENALPWLLGCARRVLANQRRGALRAEALTDRLRSAADPSGVADEDAYRLGTALERLRASDREIILLHSWEGLDLRGLATALGCSRGAAAVRLHRARRRLHQALEYAPPAAAEPETAEATR